MADTVVEDRFASFDYKAFISYNHADKDFAKWLHRGLESYKIPNKLVESQEANAAIPDRLFPVFRDREDMRAGHDLSSQIKGILAKSAYLIIVCSPNSAQSQWVNEEVKEFRRLGRANRIFTIIASGEPHASEKGRVELECFPPALWLSEDENGMPLGPVTEPIAADARAGSDGRENAKLKIIASMIDVEFDTLKKRDLEAQRRRLMINFGIAAAVFIAFLLVVIAFLAHQNSLAKADLFSAKAQGALTQRDYATAEIAAAESLTLSDTQDARELLLQAQLGGVRFVTRSPLLEKAEATALSADGQLVATAAPADAGAPVTVSITRMRTHQVLARIALPITAEMPNSITIDQDRTGRRQVAVAWPENRGTVFRVGIWNLRPGEPAGAFRELSMGSGTLGRHSKRIPSMAFNPAHDWIATGGEDGKLTLWDLSTPSPKLIWEQEKTHEPDVHGISFSPDGSLLGSAGGDYEGKIWSIADITGSHYDPKAPYAAHTTRPLHELVGHSDSAFAIAFSPDGIHAATGGYDRTIRVWEFDPKSAAKEPRTAYTLTGNEGTVFALSYSKDGKLLVSGASDGGVDLWDPEGRLLNRFTPGQGIVRSVAAPSFESGVYMASEQGWSIYSVIGSPVLKRLWSGGASVGAAVFDPSGDYLAASGVGDMGRVRVWDRTYHLVHILDPKSDKDEYINGIAFSPDGRWVVAGGGKQIIHVWDRSTKNWDKYPTDDTVLSHGGYVWGLCFDAHSKWLFSSSQSDNAQIKRWKLPDWTLDQATPTLPDSVYTLACDDRSDRVLAGDSRARVTIRGMSDLSPVEHTTNVTEGELNVWSLALAPDMHAVVSGNSDGHVYIWKPRDAAWRANQKGQKAGTAAQDATINPTINSVAYNERYHLIAAGGVGPSVELYDARSLKHVRSLRGHDGTIWWVAFDPAGTRLAYGGLDKILRVVDIAAMNDLLTAEPSSLLDKSRSNTGLTVRNNAISAY